MARIKKGLGHQSGGEFIRANPHPGSCADPELCDVNLGGGTGFAGPNWRNKAGAQAGAPLLYENYAVDGLPMTFR
jgi:hypothetical protein